MGLFSNLRKDSSKSNPSPPLPSSATIPSTDKEKRLSSKKPSKRPAARRSGNNNKSGFPTSSQMILGLGLHRSTSGTSSSSGSSFSCHGNMDSHWGVSGDEGGVEHEDEQEEDGHHSARRMWDQTDAKGAFARSPEEEGREEIMDLTISQLDGARAGEQGVSGTRASTSNFSESSASSFYCAPRLSTQTSTYTPNSSLSSGSAPSTSSSSNVQTPTLESPHRGGHGSHIPYDWSFPYTTVSPASSEHASEFNGVPPFLQEHGAKSPTTRFSTDSSKPGGNRPRASSRPSAPDPSLISQRNRSTSVASSATYASTTSSFFVPSASIASSRRPSRASGGDTSRKSSMKPSPVPITETESTPVTPTPETLSELRPVTVNLERSLTSVVDFYGQLSPVSAQPLATPPAEAELGDVWNNFVKDAAEDKPSPIQEAVGDFGVAPSAPRRPLPPPPPPGMSSAEGALESSESGEETDTGVSYKPLPSLPPTLPLPVLPLRIHRNVSPIPPNAALSTLSSAAHSTKASISSSCSITDLSAHMSALNFPKPPPISHLPTRLRSIIPSQDLELPSPSASSFGSRLSGASSTCDSPSPLTPSFPPPPAHLPLTTQYSPRQEDDAVRSTSTTLRLASGADEDEGEEENVHFDALAKIKWSVAHSGEGGDQLEEDSEQTVRVKTVRKRLGLIGEAV